MTIFCVTAPPSRKYPDLFHIVMQIRRNRRCRRRNGYSSLVGRRNWRNGSRCLVGRSRRGNNLQPAARTLFYVWIIATWIAAEIPVSLLLLLRPRLNILRGRLNIYRRLLLNHYRWLNIIRIRRSRAIPPRTYIDVSPEMVPRMPLQSTCHEQGYYSKNKTNIFSHFHTSQ